MIDNNRYTILVSAHLNDQIETSYFKKRINLHNEYENNPNFINIKLSMIIFKELNFFNYRYST